MSRDVGQPWAVAPLRGTYYGTLIIDRDGDEVLRLGRDWVNDDDDQPSARQLAAWPGATPEEVRDLCGDSHYERHGVYEAAVEIVRLVNAQAEP